jgi:rubrerythrin
MNREDRVNLLAQSLNEATRRAAQELADKQQVERIAKDVQARIAAAAEKAKLAHRLHAEAGDLQCPQCGYTTRGQLR